MTVMTVPERLVKLAELYKERNAIYGSNYKHFGKVLMGMFPDGLTLKTEEDFNRFAIFHHQVDKATRYAQNFQRGGHGDSLDDTAVYAQMLREYDDEVSPQIVVKVGKLP